MNEFEQFYLRQAQAWRERKEAARYAGDVARYQVARRECNNYAAKLPNDLKNEFWEEET